MYKNYVEIRKIFIVRKGFGSLYGDWCSKKKGKVKIKT